MKRLLFFAGLTASVIGFSQTTHSVCISEPAVICSGQSAVFHPQNLTIQQGDMIEFSTQMVATFGYDGTTHNIEFTGAPGNNVNLTISTNILSQWTYVTTPPFNTPGTYAMECTNVDHCSLFAELLSGYSCTGYGVTVTSNCSVTADFTPSATDICSGETVNFTNTSSGATSYTWKINEFPFATTTDAVQNFGAAGSFDIELIADDGAGCEDSTTVTINVTQAADAGTDESNTFCNINDSIDLNTMVTGDAGGSWAETTSSGQFNNTTGYFDYTDLTAGDYYFDYVITGTGVCPNDTAEMMITVNQEPSLTLNVTNANLATSDSAYIDFTPAGVLSGANWLWNFCDGNFDNPQTPFYYSWNAAGNFCVCVEINNYNGCTETFCDSAITVWDDAGNAELTAVEFKIYPNPADDSFTVDLSQLSGEVTLNLFNSAQQQVYEKKTNGGSSMKVDVKHLAAGKYFVQILADDQKYLIPLMIK